MPKIDIKKQKSREKARRFYQNHLEEERERQRKKWKVYVEKLKKLGIKRKRKYYPETAKRAWIKYKKKFPERVRIRRKNHEYHLRKAEGKFTLLEWEEVKKKFSFSCAICKESENNVELTIDHIIPISRGGSNYISNIQPLCRRCNSRKGNKILFESKSQEC